MAHHQLAYRHKGKLKARFAAVRVRVADGPPQRIRDKGQQHLPGEQALAHRRTQDVGRKEILSRQPAGKDRPAYLGGHHQGTMDLRAGSPAAERRTRSRSLRGPILARPASSCAHDDDRLRFPPVSPAQNSKAGKKESTGHRLNRHCPPYARPSSNSSLGYHRNDARTAENGFAAKSSVNKSAKVVLGFIVYYARLCQGPHLVYLPRCLSKKLAISSNASLVSGALTSR